MAVVMAVTVFAVSNLSFVADGEATMSVFYIRTLADFAGVLINRRYHELKMQIAAICAEPDAEKRLIRVAIYARNGFVMLRFENYCAQPVELGADGLPRSNGRKIKKQKSIRDRLPRMDFLCVSGRKFTGN